MKTKFILVVNIMLSSIFSFIFANEATSPTVKMDIYLCIGQSNMAGRAPFSGEDAKVIENCYLLNGKDKWEPAKNPLNRYSTIRKNIKMQRLGPAYMFSKIMSENNGDKPIGLVVNAKGGTSSKLWGKCTKFYSEAVRRTKIALKNGTVYY